jgi:hypothetical protein
MQHIDTKIEAARISGGVALLGTYKVTLEEIVLLLTIAYFILQIVILTPRAIRAIGEIISSLKRRKGSDNAPNA